MQWPFEKYVGCGNDFILFDNREDIFPVLQVEFIQSLCHRQKGIGADGILLLEPSSRADYKMRVINADGSEAEMCGNGLRCFAKWIQTFNTNRSNFKIEVANRIFNAKFNAESCVTIEMGMPIDSIRSIQLPYREEILTIYSLNTGVPHALIFVDNSEEARLDELGPYIRHHSTWAPNGTNVSVIEKTGKQCLKIRTFERGVEGETLACGTAATAAALTTSFLNNDSGPYFVETRSGEKLTVDFNLKDGVFSRVTLTGEAKYVFSGRVFLSNDHHQKRI